MLRITAFLVDLSIIGIVVFCTWRGYKNGLIRGVFGIVALIVSLLVANIAAEAYSNEASGALAPFVGGVVESTFSDLVEEGLDESVLLEQQIDTVEFGTAYSALRRIGLPEAAAAHIAEMAVMEEEPGTMLTDLIADKLSSALAFVAVFTIAFVLLAIVFAVVGNLIGFVFSLPGMKWIDIIAGSVLGLAKGIIIVYTIAVFARYFGLLAIGTLESTSVLNYLVNNNPIANALGV